MERRMLKNLVTLDDKSVCSQTLQEIHDAVFVQPSRRAAAAKAQTAFACQKSGRKRKATEKRPELDENDNRTEVKAVPVKPRRRLRDWIKKNDAEFEQFLEGLEVKPFPTEEEFYKSKDSGAIVKAAVKGVKKDFPEFF
ncbi:Oidioi.mRNA.OKI2018_I69.XSR.g16082.t1.cds [Oikopleura dioica]|uniref:Oidioi.mRNA.OKI2018_I69.XSR.g16082.t1.cds n=1 Tax=Oikopleura dioica TaxID=34765 RepID=A0ABN7SFG3_OIKDI|nr:Oidioi.mRNA.OKI2018_I69.XSR.g16082.t1.cds [Oikopleura dioica]